MAEESLDQATVAFVLLHQSAVLLPESVALLCLQCHLAFELRDVFYDSLANRYDVIWSDSDTNPFS